MQLEMDQNQDEFNKEEFIDQDDIEEVIELDDDNPPDIGDTNHIEDVDEFEEMIDVPDESIVNFTEHNEAVLCCDVSHDDKLVVTGGQDDKAIVWDASDRKVLFETNGHKDSVVAVKFNKNSTMVATGDLSGIVQVWNLSGERLYDFEVDDVNWILWHPISDNVLFAGTTSGDAWMWKLSQTNPQFKTFLSYGYGNVTAKIFDDGKRIAMGYEDGSIRIWDLKEALVIYSVADYQSHAGSVISLDLSLDNSLIASGSTDSTVKIINANNGKVLATISCGVSNKPEEKDSIESVSFGAKNQLAIGTVNGSIEIWDISTQTKRNDMKLDFGVSKISVDKSNPNILYAGCLDSYFRVIDLRNCEIILQRSGHNDQILDYCVSSDSKHVLTCSEDSTCRIFSLIN